MKKRILSFLAGMLTMALIGALAVPVLASAGMIITVDPINIQVNGTTFQPKDVKGNVVPVFAYNGTTYAPLRALAEAYGLEVGYNNKMNMATVNEKTFEDVPIAFTSLEKCNVKIVKKQDKYYYFYQGYEQDKAVHYLEYYRLMIDNQELVFCRDISALSTGSYRMDQSPAYYAIALAQNAFGLTTSINPNVDGSINIPNLNLAYSSVVNTGEDQTQYYSASKSYTPEWMECNGVKVYKNSSIQSGLYTVDGIRYYDSYICLDDLFKKIGYSYTIKTGTYQGLNYIEIN